MSRARERWDAFWRAIPRRASLVLLLLSLPTPRRLALPEVEQVLSLATASHVHSVDDDIAARGGAARDAGGERAHPALDASITAMRRCVSARPSREGFPRGGEASA